MTYGMLRVGISVLLALTLSWLCQASPYATVIRATSPVASVSADYGHYATPLGDMRCGDNLCQEKLGDGNTRYYDYTVGRNNPYGDVAHVFLQNANSQILAQLTYDYNADDSVRTETLSDEQGATERHVYVYDALHRLVQVRDEQTQMRADNTSSQQGRHVNITTFAYDVNGNTVLSGVSGAASTSWHYDGLDKTDGLKYDKSGNVTDEPQTQTEYRYDDYNRMIGVTVGHEIYRYAYDPDGLRASKKMAFVDSDDGSYHRRNDQASINAAHHGDDELDYYYGGQELTNAVDRANGEVSHYLDRIARMLTDADGRVVADGSHYYFGNFQDSILKEIGSGTVIRNKRYTPYGDRSAAALDEHRENAVPDIRQDPLGFDGQMRDGETGNIYLRARMYDPKLRQFLQQDNYNFFNRYHFADANPVMYTDPSGHASEAWSKIKEWLPNRTQEWVHALVPLSMAAIVPGTGLLLSGGLATVVHGSSYVTANWDNRHEIEDFWGWMSVASVMGFGAGALTYAAVQKINPTKITATLLFNTAAGALSSTIATLSDGVHVLANAVMENEPFNTEEMRRFSRNLLIGMVVGGVVGGLSSSVLALKQAKLQFYINKYNKQIGGARSNRKPYIGSNEDGSLLDVAYFSSEHDIGIGTYDLLRNYTLRPQWSYYRENLNLKFVDPFRKIGKGIKAGGTKIGRGIKAGGKKLAGLFPNK